MKEHKKKEFMLDYLIVVKPILDHPEFQRRKEYVHHGEESVYDHSLKVSKKAYLLAKRFHLNARNAAIAGLLHDFYLKPWMTEPKADHFLEGHGFVHARQAKENAQLYFPELMNDRTLNAIERHMFPLNKIPPKHIEGWLVTLADKYVSMEIFKHPLQLHYYLGYKKKGGKK